jgi:hypothetical protein
VEDELFIVNVLGCYGFTDEGRGKVRRLFTMHSRSHDLATVDVDDEVKIEEDASNWAS